jgi:hypothetical protein
MPARKKAANALQDAREARLARHLSLVESGGPVEVPEPPPGMLRETVERWEGFWRSPIAAAVDAGSDLAGLHRWARAHDEWLRASRALKRARVVKGSTGQPVMSPLAAYALQRSAEMLALERQYGMTPRSRLDLGLTTAQAELTVARLNEMTAQRDDGADEPQVFEGDWRPA